LGNTVTPTSFRDSKRSSTRRSGRDHRGGRLERRRRLLVLQAGAFLLEKDKWGNWCHQQGIKRRYATPKALCKLEGFTYSPSETEYFIHGYSTESDFIYVTTRT
jgi:hypothetical protein